MLLGKKRGCLISKKEKEMRRMGRKEKEQGERT
jgi:hypothetical protein